MAWVDRIAGSRTRKLLRRLLLLIGGSGIAALAGEVGVRLVAPQATAVPWQDELDGVTCPRKGVDGRHAIPGCFDVRVTFGSERFRGRRPVERRPAEGVLRVAVLGDSFTFGYGAEDDETYPARLEAALGPEAVSRGWSGVEVVNAGNGGTGPGDQALWYDVWVREFAPRLVVLSVVANDVDDDLARGHFVRGEDGSWGPRPVEERRAADSSVRSTRGLVNGIPGYGFLAERSQLLAVLRNAASAFLARRRSGETGPYDEGAARGRIEAEGLARLTGELRWLARRVEADGARLAIAFLPSRESVLDAGAPASEPIEWRSARIVATLRRVAGEERLPFADLTPAMVARVPGASAPLYYEGRDTHPTPGGYQAIAEEVAALLVRGGSLER